MVDVRLVGLVGVLASACAASDAPDATAGGTGTTTTGSDESSTSVPGEASTTSGDEVDDASSTGEPLDPCSAADPAGGCPDGCIEASVYSIDDVVACTATSTRQCVSGSFDDTPAPPGTYYSGNGFVIVGDGPCGEYVALDGWTECRLDAPEQPAACNCLCREGVCHGDEDRLALAMCGADVLCPPVTADPFAPFDYDAARCILTALRDRTPGVVSAGYSTSYTLDQATAYLDGTDVARAVQAEAGDLIVCPGAISPWKEAEDCTLAAPAVFAACLARDDDELAECMQGSDVWFGECTPAAPSCG
jgi:hypothetical protein